MYNIPEGSFEWDEAKEEANREKHGVSFWEAQWAFLDPGCILAVDLAHSTESEQRLYCIGKLPEGIP